MTIITGKQLNEFHVGWDGGIDSEEISTAMAKEFEIVITDILRNLKKDDTVNRFGYFILSENKKE